MRFQSGTSFACLTGLAGAVLLWGSSSARAVDSLGQKWLDALRGQAPHETALGLYAGRAYDWADMYFGMASLQVLFPHTALWLIPSPEGLKVRFEGNLGTAVGTEFSGARLVASGNFLAVYEFGTLRTARIVPYAEAGVGLIYTDFQRDEQPFRVNFNPVAGVGLRMKSTFVTLRFHHLSNGGLGSDNRGLNSLILGFGVYLGAGR